MTAEQTGPAPEKQSDLMLWLAAAAVVGIGLTWLLISQPWKAVFSADPAVAALPVAPSLPAAVPPSATPPSATAAAATAPEGDTAQTGMSLDNPLRMAQLAYEAGMLVEPADYSAWALFSRALAEDPANEQARGGLEQVAADLLARGSSALEQGRFDDVRATVARVRSVLPDHAGAAELAARLAEQAPPPRRPAPAARTAEVAAPREAPASARPAPAPRVDPVIAMHESFRSALAANQLLTPADSSARHFVEQMLAEDAEHELATVARDLLVTEMLSRSKQSLEALDLDAARTWIDEAEPIAADPVAIYKARELLTEGLIALETEKQLPASALTIRHYRAPEFPGAARSRGIQGWVDIEFTVARDGSTEDVRIVDASHDRYFRDEALEAVEEWEFEPREFMGQPIPQRSYTRVSFVIAD